VHQTLSQQDLARAQSVANSTLVTDNPDTYGEEVEYWLDTENPGKGWGCEGKLSKHLIGRGALPIVWLSLALEQSINVPFRVLLSENAFLLYLIQFFPLRLYFLSS
ncbi:unnamed protein product, partial [Ectocarpus sp. 8 AP-2014]